MKTQQKGNRIFPELKGKSSITLNTTGKIHQKTASSKTTTTSVENPKERTALTTIMRSHNGEMSNAAEKKVTDSTTQETAEIRGKQKETDWTDERSRKFSQVDM